MKHIKTFKKYSPIGKNIIIVESMNCDKEIEVSKNILSENSIIGKNIIKVIPGKDKVYIK